MPHRDTALSVLRAWQVLEFFQPYDLPKPPNGERNKRYKLGRDKCQKLSELPWRNPPWVPHGYEYRYTLYLGVFDKKAATEELRSAGLLGKEGSTKAVDAAERVPDEGSTCVAKVTVNHAGEIDYESLSFSTLPWALGRLRHYGVEELTPEKLESGWLDLKQKLDNHRNEVFEESDGRGGVLGESELGSRRLWEFLRVLWNWVEFSPSNAEYGHATLMVDQVMVKTPQNDNHRAEDTDSQDQDDGETVSLDGSDERTMPILNSFFINDLQNAYNMIEAGRANPALLHYMRGHTGAATSDLYSPEGLQNIKSVAHYRNTPAGRWPSNPEHSMSLMQQYAINLTSKELAGTGIRSVNGPPGTGKTTMLREIVADNLVRRARALAQFSSPCKAINPNGTLDESITGFEMVVASANNAAVQNISEEIPSIEAIDAPFEDMDYLSGVANAVKAARARNDKRSEREKAHSIATGEDRCWGLLAGVAGKAANLNALKSGMFFHSTDAIIERDDGTLAAGTIFQWRHRYKDKGPSFDQAKSRLKQAEREYAQLCELIDRYFEALKTLREQPESLAAFRKRREADLAPLRRDLKGLEQSVSNAAHQLKVATAHHQNKANELDRLRNERPRYNWLKAKWHAETLRDYDRRIGALNGEVREAAEQARRRQRAFDEAKNALSRRRKTLNDRSDSWDRQWVTQRSEHDKRQRQAEEAKDAFHSRFNPTTGAQTDAWSMRVPSPGDEIDNPDLQRKAYFQHPLINKARTKVFKAALALHESWLAQVLVDKRFNEQVSQLRENMDKPKLMTQSLWQILFMMVPVLSSTFASLGRMLGSVPGGGIGWVLIDEAGQAPPPQAVGALHRARSGVIVGDPLQIKPVVTTSPSLIERIMETVPVDERRQKDPSVQSVQTLADAANPYGCTIRTVDGEQRIGIPLWVHRRCLNPMFSLSNEIAYNNRMVHGNNAPHPRDHALLGPNIWIDSTNHDAGGGSAGKNRQYMPAQGQILVELLRRFLTAGGDENELYVVSPFKAVKEGLKKRVRTNAKALGEAAVWTQVVEDTPETDAKGRAGQIRKWAGKSIGTVHTFQGRENATVILVLGCDSTTRGAISWAGSAPNILNVAATRAKKNLFVVGPRALWSDQNDFERMAHKLEVAYSVDQVLDDPMASWGDALPVSDNQ